MAQPYETPSELNQGLMELFLVVLVSIVFPPILLFGFFVVNPRMPMSEVKGMS